MRKKSKPKSKMLTAVYPTWSSPPSTILSDFQSATQMMKAATGVNPNHFTVSYPSLYNHTPLYCAEDGKEVFKELKSMHLCMTGLSHDCITLYFCNDACEVMWNCRNMDYLDNKGTHGSQYHFNSETQFKKFIAKPIKQFPYTYDYFDRNMSADWWSKYNYLYGTPPAKTAAYVTMADLKMGSGMVNVDFMAVGDGDIGMGDLVTLSTDASVEAMTK